MGSDIKIKTWKDIEKIYPHFKDDIDKLERNVLYISDRLREKLIATYKIEKLIEHAYGGKITSEEWRNRDKVKYYIADDEYDEFDIYSTYNKNLTDFICFHTRQQAIDFLFYPENRQLVKQYYI